VYLVYFDGFSPSNLCYLWGPASLCDVGFTPVRDDPSAPRDLSVSNRALCSYSFPQERRRDFGLGPYLTSR
jgi:hypothetical protein